MSLYIGENLVSGGGTSPFEVAQKAGYTGTEAEFNALLVNIPSAAEQAAWNAKADPATTLAGYGITDGITRSVADDSYATQDHTHLASDLGVIPSTEKGAANGVASLGDDGKVPSGQLPDMDYAPASHVDDAVKHITAEERSAWDAKATTELVTEHAADTRLHITNTERTTWNNAATTADETIAAVEAAQESANDALNIAQSAQSTATTAQTTANSALNEAQTAQSNADIALATAQAAGMSITKLADGAYVTFTSNYNTGTITSSWLTNYRALLFVWASGQGYFAPILVPTNFLMDGKQVSCTLYSSSNLITPTLTNVVTMSFSVSSTYYRISQCYYTSESTKYGDGSMPYVYGIK